MQESLMGRFCRECEKEVTDFTKFTNDELINYFKTNKIREGCGRFLTSQLETVKIPVDIGMLERRRTPQWQKFLVVLLFCFGRSLFNTEVVFGQNIARDSGRHTFFCDSSLPSETFDLKDTIQYNEPEPAVVCAEPELNKPEDSFSIPDSVLYQPVSIKFDESINIVLGGFGMYPENQCKFQSFEMMNYILQVPPSEEDSNAVVENTLLLHNIVASKPNRPKQDKSPDPEEKKNDIPFEAILPGNNKKNRRKK